MKKNIETRALKIDTIEQRKNPDGTTTLTGYAALYDNLSHDLGGFKETIRKGTFKRAIAEGQNVIANTDHDNVRKIADTESGLLSLRSDNKGLAYELNVPDTTDGRDLLVKVYHKIIRSMSFAFQTVKDTWKNVDGQRVRELVDVDLFDIAFLHGEPAYPNTEIALRSLQEFEAEEAPAITPEDTQDLADKPMDADKVAEALNIPKAKLRLLELE